MEQSQSCEDGSVIVEGWDFLFPLFVAAVDNERYYVMWCRQDSDCEYCYSVWYAYHYFQALNIRQALFIAQFQAEHDGIESRDYRVTEYRLRVMGFELP
jgi:hypothetical protein